MSDSSIVDDIKLIVAKQLDRDPATLDENTDLAAAGYESLDVIETVFAIEDKFNISIPFNANEGDAAKLSTIGGIVKLVEEIIAADKPK
jgi:acyl carrier protein